MLKSNEELTRLLLAIDSPPPKEIHQKRLQKQEIVIDEDVIQNEPESK
jgi:hypothetical protein